MHDNPRVDELLEELHVSGGTPEEICRDCPELLAQVRSGWEGLRAVEAEVDALFPQSAALDDAGRQTLPTTELPRIRGYELQGVLGHGGVGVVYKAWHLRLNRVVALKMLLAGAYARPQELERFLREAEAVAGLRHANIVQVHDVGDLDGRPYFTMEFVEGGSLSQKLAGTPQPARAAAALVATLAEAVQAAHQSGVVHRDLKPANILLTADGTPKISDFGLARRLEGARPHSRMLPEQFCPGTPGQNYEGGLTLSGVPMGTPSYMAPEQAAGQKDAIGPATDVYALGGILYEMLTGRPPFRAETAAATIQQVLGQDPAPPGRLNGKAPRDLETICLKCLHKEPRLRYANAAALGEDLHRFLRGEAIAARPEGRLGRLARQIRRRPLFSAALATATLLTAALIGCGLYLISERAAIEKAVEEDLREVARLQDSSSWPEAKAALERAKGRLGLSEPAGAGAKGSAGAPSRVRRLLDQGARELALVVRLDAIRLNRAANLGGKQSFTRSDEDYEAAFREHGLGNVLDAPDLVAERVKASNVRDALVAALDDWTSCTLDPERQKWLLAVTRQADRDPTGWRGRARDPETWAVKGNLAEAARTAPVADQSVPLLLALAEHMKVLGDDPIPFLTRVQQAHPGDFWANFSLGEALKDKNNPQEAVRYYQAAAAIRPRASVVYDNLGLMLAMLGRMDEADEQFRQASRIDPTATPAHSNLGIIFSGMGRRDEAIDPSKLTFRFNPKVAQLHAILGANLKDKGKLDLAIDRYRLAIALDPKLLSAQQGLRSILKRQGRLEDVRVAWGKAIDADPPEHGAWDGYAEFCLYLGQVDEYRRVRRALLDRFGASTDPLVAERTGRACLLMPASPDELRRASALIDRALAAEKNQKPSWAYSYYLFAKGLAEYRQGHMDGVISGKEWEEPKVLDPAYQLVEAMAQHRQGRKTEACKSLATAALAFDWQPLHSENREAWIYHVLLREAEATILPNQPAYVQGKYQPWDKVRRLALIEHCRNLDLPYASVRLYAAAFVADHRLSEDLSASHRYNAARAAALAGSGSGEDGAGLGEAERSRWRGQARQWLWADLAAWARRTDGDPKTVRDLVRRTLTQWRNEPDLAGLREPVELARMSAHERADCLALWNEVGAVLQHNGKVR
jgi:eukaryotic-like serine/threonine-protein kinase